MPLASRIDENRSILSLNLAWNGLGNEGAVPLGMAVRLNSVMKTLDVAHNDIQERGTMVLADALKENTTLDTLLLDSNPIGPDGGRAVLRALKVMAERQQEGRTISISHCNLECDDGEDLFDPLEPGGTWVCRLSDPYERVVANELVELAWKSDGENWENETLDGAPYALPEPEPGEVWTRDDFSLPEDGTLSVTYVPTKRVPRMEDVVSERVFDLVVSLMRHKAVTDQGLQLLRLAASEFFFSSDQVARLLKLFIDSPTRVNAMTFLQSRTVDYMNWTARIYSSMTDAELRSLEQKLGQTFYFTPSNPTGHYRLNLANPHERTIARRIIEISSEEKVSRKAMPGDAINTSQRGDWDNWRNESLDKEPWDYDESDPKTSRLPDTGILEFDYVSTNVSHRMIPTLPISKRDFQNLLTDLEAIANVVTVVGTKADEQLRALPGKANAKRRWKLARSMLGSKGLWRRAVGGMSAADVLRKSVLKAGEGDDNEEKQQEEEEEEEEEEGQRAAWWIPAQNLHVRVPTEAEREAAVKSRQVRMLRRSTLSYYYTAAQAKRIVETVAKSARLEACVILFSRILDLENHRPEALLSAVEYAGSDHGESHSHGHLGVVNPHSDTSSYLARIGLANAFNPFACDRHKELPEGTGMPSLYDLRLGLAEERVVAKLLVALAAEAGTNWSDEMLSGMPFQLSAGWASPEPACKIPSAGSVSLRLRCDAGTIDPSIRSNMARRLLMPGPGRWRCLDESLLDKEVPAGETINVCEEQLTRSADPEEFDDHTDTSRLALDADGTIKSVDCVFRDFDRDGSGSLSREEFLRALRRLRVPSHVATRLWAKADGEASPRGGDGEVDLGEFEELWGEMRQAMA